MEVESSVIFDLIFFLKINPNFDCGSFKLFSLGIYEENIDLHLHGFRYVMFYQDRMKVKSCTCRRSLLQGTASFYLFLISPAHVSWTPDKAAIFESPFEVA